MCLIDFETLRLSLHGRVSGRAARTAFGSSSCTKMKNGARALLASVRGGHGQGTRDAEIFLKVCDGFRMLRIDFETSEIGF